MPLRPKKWEILISYKAGTHIPALDGIRGFAIIAVLLFHCFPYLSIFKLGWTGVDLFFVLSGFLITGILVDTVNRKTYYKNFILKRILRIFPLYYLSLLVFVFFIPRWGSNIATHLDLEYSVVHQAWYWLYASNWLLTFKTGWVHGAGINHFWSLAIEEQFYLVWPVFILLFRKKRKLTLCLFTIGLALATRVILYCYNFPHYGLYMLTITRADALALGGCVAILVRSHAGIAFLNKYTPYIFGCLLVILVGGMIASHSTNPYSGFFSTVGYTILDMLFASSIILVLSNFLFFKRLFSSDILKFFGKYSYSMYIFHHPIIVYFLSISDQFFPGSKWNLPLISIISIGLTIIISLLTWYLFEEKVLRLKKLIK